MTNSSNFIQATGLWLKDGKISKYMSGNMGGVSVFVFKNDKKKSDNQPDYFLCFAPARKRRDEEAEEMEPEPDYNEPPF